MPAGNRRLAQWRVTWLIEHSTSHQLLWCIDSFVLRNPPLRQAPKRCGEIRSAPFATTFARITSASCAAASRTSHNKLICKILKSRVNSNLELHKSARTLYKIFIFLHRLLLDNFKSIYYFKKIIFIFWIYF